MLRAVAFELLTGLIPVIAYVLWLLASGRPPFHPREWTQKRIVILVVASLVSTLIGLAAFGHFTRAPAGSSYVPATFENGVFKGPQFK